MSALDTVLEDAARAVGCFSDQWIQTDGDNTGPGEDYYYTLTTGAGANLSLYINADQEHWKWQVASEDGSLGAEGKVEFEPEETLEEATMRMTDKAKEFDGMYVLATWTSVWDEGFEVDAPCLLTADLSRVEEIFSVEGVDDEGEDLVSLDSEHVTLQDGRTIAVTRDDRGDVVLGIPVVAIGLRV